MNDARRTEIQRALTLIEQAKGIFEVALAKKILTTCPRTSETTKLGKEPRTRLTHWSAPRRAATMQCPPARRRYRSSIADEVPARGHRWSRGRWYLAVRFETYLGF
jgi:hypothetical protein